MRQRRYPAPLWIEAGVGAALLKNKIFEQVEGNGNNVRVKVCTFYSAGFACEGEIGICISERTIARIRRHGDKEHKDQDRKIRRQTNL